MLSPPKQKGGAPRDGHRRAPLVSNEHRERKSARAAAQAEADVAWLRDGWAELACALGFARAAWRDAPLVPLDRFRGYEARSVMRAVAEVRSAGEDVTLEAVARVSGLPLELLERLEDQVYSTMRCVDSMNRARMPKGDVKTSFFLPKRLLRAAKARAARDGISLRALLVAALVAYLAPNEKEGNA